MFYTVYKITNLNVNKIYIGAHKTTNLEDGYMGSGTYITNSINKYGVDNFTKEILHILDSEEEMYLKEKEIVNLEFLSRDDVYNLNEGGDGGWNYINTNRLNVTENTIKNSIKNLEKANAKNRELVKQGLHRKGFTLSDETKNKISQSNIGKQAGDKNPMYNKKAIKKEGISICVDIGELEEYFKDGWELGQIQNKPDFSGDKNPQFGKFWITNGEISLTIYETQFEEYLLLGYRKGRVCSKTSKKENK